MRRGANAARTTKARKGKSKRIRRRQTALAINITSILLSVIIIAGVGLMWTRGGVGGDFNGDGNGKPVIVEVAQGSSLSDISQELVDKGIVATTSAFMSAANDNPDSDNLQPGFYRLEEHMSAQSAVAALLDPEKQAGNVDIPTGTRLTDIKVVAANDVRKGIYTLLSEASCTGEDQCITKEEFEQVAANTDPAELGVPDWARDRVLAQGNDPRRIEGLITPGIHQFHPESNAKEILTKLITSSTESYEETGLTTAAETVGLAPYDLITAASLIQMESPDGDFDKVARVILNRLHEPMQLQFDSTVNYDLTEQEVATSDEDRARQTPWNTYAMDGLPATPISSPSLEAIQAMENPADGTWLYFVTIDLEGTTVFNTTFEEHEAAIELSRQNGVLDSNR
ncbi:MULTISPECIES: endolytic transglycosylase MltG [unclassified Corynebacterium]|uniref:endolytic transglycosylase MltG n=1 Tax=unclassified Corynebacterium TaxID=2624378 RepID=UPI0030AAD87F